MLSLLLTITYAHAEEVKLLDSGGAYVLDNGILEVRVEKRGGTYSVRYKGQEVVVRGYWSQVGRGSNGSIGRYGSKVSASVKIDPKSNGKERAEVAVRFEPAGNEPCLPCDVEMCYGIGKDDSAIYSYAVWEHKPGQASFSVGEGRMAWKLNTALFDYMVIDKDRMLQMPVGADWDKAEQLNMKEVRRITTGPLAGRVEHKYDYSAILADTPAYGWTSTSAHVGVWLINPSIEYLGGGPTKEELTGHVDVNPGGAPTLLNMWHGSHYGGSALAVAHDEPWKKMIGPFLIYCNSGQTHEEMWKDALGRAEKEKKQWPYAWVKEEEYPPAQERAIVNGKLRVEDDAKWKQMWVGLVQSDDWQRDSKHYQFWAMADEEGKFEIGNVRPGNYKLVAFAQGILGEFAGGELKLAKSERKELGELIWKPKRYGKTIWQIGVADRTAREFRHGDHYWQWGLYYEYPREFPRDVDFVIGKSDPRVDWNYCQPPRIEGNKASPTTWTIRFQMPQPTHAKAMLRLAFAGSRGRGGILVSVNGHDAGSTGPLPDTGVMHRDGIRGYWFERDVAFDGSMLNQGQNTIQLTNPARSWVDGVLYDCLRLELSQ